MSSHRLEVIGYVIDPRLICRLASQTQKCNFKTSKAGLASHRAMLRLNPLPYDIYCEQVCYEKKSLSFADKQAKPMTAATMITGTVFSLDLLVVKTCLEDLVRIDSKVAGGSLHPLVAVTQDSK